MKKNLIIQQKIFLQTTNESGMMMNASKSIIIKYKIYISTLSNLGPLMHIKFMRDHFTHVIIDEV